jgi:hypothetical protein
MVDTVCPRAGYRRIAFHSRGCVEPLWSGEEERSVRMLVCTHVSYKHIGVPNPIPWKIPYVPYRPTKVNPLSKFPLVTKSKTQNSSVPNHQSVCSLHVKTNIHYPSIRDPRYQTLTRWHPS